ncbi:oxidoreductase [Pedobacter sp. JY14-1]|uniref:oxidoreductase n=1 Tax=Pedobacter sp. JY14-1 TaxID=3034151 RepID=UPI0023E22147|nr:oxidoreductase [Pedobacter sp. JY14-1]
MNRLKDKIVVITGGSGLLGRDIIKSINIAGGKCINLDIQQDTPDAENFFYCDVTSESSVKAVIELIVSKFGRIDGLVNNAYPRTGDWGTRFEEISYTSWQQNIDWQLNSYFMLTQKVAKQMISQKSGSIVTMSSIYGMVGPDFTVYEGTGMTMPTAYSAIKGGLINFTRYIASYLGPHNIRANCVSPGGIFDNQNPIFVKNYEAKVPMRRMGLPDDISPVVVFLLSDDAKYLTGQNLAVDGGWTCI